MKCLADLCTPRQSVFDLQRRDVVLDLSDLIDQRIEADKFFEENFLTDGMKRLLREAFRRFAGKSDQGVFVLSQAMGGGKTHNMIALGLLAQEPSLRKKVMGELYEASDALGKVRVVGFTGRETDAPLGVWGSIAEQLRKKDQFKDYYSPLQAPGLSAWVNLLKGEPLLILLDELPPYFEAARSKMVGNSDLAQVTAAALSNLLVAVGKKELANVCVVISDLRATYQGGSQQLHAVLQNFEGEVGRSAITLEPVGLNTNELYHILRTRLFSSLPSEDDVRTVAKAYAQAVKDAKQMDITSASPEHFATQLEESYPFHFALKDLYARFRENPGFQQTRGLIRFMRVLVARLWQSKRAETLSLIHPYDVDLNDRETIAEIQAINPTLDNAISHDIAAGGSAVAEVLDKRLPGSDTDAQDAAKLLLMASLGSASGATLGLRLTEAVSYLCRPGRNVSRLPKDVIGVLTTTAWYLHSDREGRLFFKNVQNLIAKLNTTAAAYTREIRLKQLQSFLARIFEPSVSDCYQTVKALPPVDEIELQQDKVLLVIAEAAPAGGLVDDLRKFWDDTTWRNRVCFLTGERETSDKLLDTAAELKAIDHILAEMRAEKVPEKDPQFQSAEDISEKVQMRMLSVARESFTQIFYPGADGLLMADFLMNFANNKYNGEQQVKEALASKQKFTNDIDSDTFRKKCEQRLFTQQVMPWPEIKKRAASNTRWQWHHPSALDSLKARMIMEGQWREEGGLIDKGPFPEPDTSVRVQELKRNDDTGEVTLRITPVHADTVYCEIGSEATTGSQKISDLQNFPTSDLHLTFLAVDSTGTHATGPVVHWKNMITLKYRLFQQGKGLMCELQAGPPAKILYSTDGSDPRQAGGMYEEPFLVPKGAVYILAMAQKNGVESTPLRIPVPERPDEVQIDPNLPITWRRFQEARETKATYDLLGLIKKHQAKTLGMRAAVFAGKYWLETSADEKFPLDGAQIETLLRPLREIMTEGQAEFETAALFFEKGQHLLDWVAETKTEIKPSEIAQEANKSS
jgi:hypothetical protein